MTILQIRLTALLGATLGGLLAITAAIVGWMIYAWALAFATVGCLVVAIFALDLFPPRAKRDKNNNN